MENYWKYCFRMRPYFRNVGLICTVFFAVVGLVSTLAAYFNVDGSFPRPKLAALVLGIFWFAFTLLGVWLLLLYYKYRLLVNDSMLRQIGVLRDDQADLNLVDELKWRCFPQGGSIRISGIFGVLKIELGNFNTADRERLIAFFRQTITETRQLGWQKFNDQFADTPDKRRRSRRFRVFLIFIIGIYAIAFGMVGVVWGNMLCLVVSGVNGLMTAYLFREHFRTKQ